MAELSSPQSKDSIIKGLVECFGVEKGVVSAILTSQTWNMEKSLKILESISPKVNSKKKGGARPNDGNKDSKGGTDAKKKAGNKIKTPTENNTPKIKACSSGSKENTAIHHGIVRKPMPRVKAEDEFKIQGCKDKKPRSVAKTKQSTQSPCLNLSKAQPKSTSEQPSSSDSKKAKRNLLKSVYDIVKQKGNAVDRVRDCIKFEIKIIVLMRGCPGSGKSTYANELLMLNGVKNPQSHIFSTDNYFFDSKGNYNYNKDNLDKAHNWNQDLVEKVMKIGLSPVVIDNTHVKAWEMMCYAQYAIRLGYVLETLEPPTPWFFNGSILAKKNAHNVPKEKIILMLDSYEKNLSGDMLLKIFNIEYNLQQVPPQSVSYPKDQIINVLNKAFAGKAVPSLNTKKKSMQIFSNSQKSNLKVILPSPSDLEIRKTISLKNDLTQKSHSSGKNILPQNVGKSKNQNQSQTKLPSGFDNLKYTGKDFKASGLVQGNENVTGFSAFHFLMNSKQSSSNEAPLSSMSPSYSDPNNSQSVNLIDNPIDVYLENALVNPLTPLINYRDDMIDSADKPGYLDPSDFPSLSSSSSNSCKINSNNDFTKTKIHEEKTKKITELFPHLDKEYISYLCSEPTKNLDDIVETLLNKPPNPQAQTVESTETISNVSSMDVESSDEEDNVEDSEVEKDMSMLVQLFPNKKEIKIREMYNKCGNDLKIALEWLLHDESDEESSEEEDSEPSAPAYEDIEDETKGEEALEFFQKSYASLRTDDAESSKVDVDCAFSDQSSIITDKSESSNFAADIKSDTGDVSQSKVSDKDINLNKGDLESALGDLNLQTVGDDSSTTFSASISERDEKISSSVNDLKLESERGQISMSNLEMAVKNALSCLENNSDAILNCSKNENVASENLDDVNSKKSSLLSKIMDWNLDGGSSHKMTEKSIDSSPKDQREHDSDIQNASTNTNYKDFENLKLAQLGRMASDKVLIGTGNFISCYEPADKVHLPKVRPTLDQSTCTEEVERSYNVSDEGAGTLLAMFPTLPLSDLSSLLKECMGDLNWAVGLLLDSGLEISPDFNPSEHTLTNSEISEGNSGDGDSTSQPTPPSTTEPPDSPQTHKSKKRNTQRIPVENINYVMSDKSISSHVRKIRNARLGITDMSDEKFEPFPSSSEVLAGSSEEEDEEEETLDVALSTDFILALQAQFGGFIPNILPGQQALVTLPVYLARQLHSCIMDSLSRQLQEEQKLIDKMIQEDEWLARRLQEMENGDGEVHHQSIQDIMDEELSLNIHKSINREKGSDKETMASRLSCQLLIERFPTMDPVVLKSLLEDTNHSLDQATKLLEAAGYQSANPASHLTSTPQPSLDIGAEALSREEAVEQAGLYREAAKISFQMRHDCFQKAQRAYTEGNKHVASYYSQMANWHNQKIEQANLLASTMLLSGNTKLTTLDLHFLRVCEAIQVLDLFIDAHVSNLIEIKQRKRQVYIITGRGLHSYDGRSRIRPATISKLKQRSIWYQLVNPGLLMVELTHKTPLTYQK